MLSNNPFFAFKLLKEYLIDRDRVWNHSEKKIRTYQNHSLQKMVQFAFTIPFYKKIYDSNGIKKHDITSLKDISILPKVTKHDLRKAYPTDLLSSHQQSSSLFPVSTSGGSGEPVSLYTSISTICHTLIGYARILKEHNINWRKTKIVVISDLSEQSIEMEYFTGQGLPFIKKFFSLPNIQLFHMQDDPIEIIQKMNSFQPQVIGGYPSMLKTLAIYKARGMGEKIRPDITATSGELLDYPTRHLIESSFDAPLFDVYGATECDPIAFQCKNGNYHVQSDFVYLELEPSCESNQFHKPVITRLFGDGTPIIRYQGISDIIIPSYRSCNCGMNTPLIERIEGRQADCIILPDKTIMPPLTITGIPYKIMTKYKSNAIHQFQIIQQNHNHIDILIVLNKSEKQTEKITQLLNSLKNEYQKRLGKHISVNLQVVDQIPSTNNSPLNPVVISNVSMEDI